MDLQGSQANEGTTRAITKGVTTSSAQPSATLSKATLPSTEVKQLPTQVAQDQSIQQGPSLMVPSQQNAQHKDLPCPTPPPPPKEETYMPAIETSNGEVNRPVTSSDQTETPIEGNKEEVFHIPNIDDQQVTKRGGTEATDEVDRAIPYFDEMLDMDALYKLAHYPFDTEIVEDAGRGTHCNDEAAVDVTQAPNANKVIEESKTSAVVDPTHPPITENKIEALETSTNAENIDPPPQT